MQPLPATTEITPCAFQLAALQLRYFRVTGENHITLPMRPFVAPPSLLGDEPEQLVQLFAPPPAAAAPSVAEYTAQLAAMAAAPLPNGMRWLHVYMPVIIEAFDRAQRSFFTAARYTELAEHWSIPVLMAEQAFRDSVNALVEAITARGGLNLFASWLAPPPPPVTPLSTHFARMQLLGDVTMGYLEAPLQELIVTHQAHWDTLDRALILAGRGRARRLVRPRPVERESEAKEQQ
jgi:hypothetical protein